MALQRTPVLQAKQVLGTETEQDSYKASYTSKTLHIVVITGLSALSKEVRRH